MIIGNTFISLGFLAAVVPAPTEDDPGRARIILASGQKFFITGQQATALLAEIDRQEREVRERPDFFVTNLEGLKQQILKKIDQDKSPFENDDKIFDEKEGNG